MNEVEFMKWAMAEISKRAGFNKWISIQTFGDKDKIIIVSNFGRYDYDRKAGEASEV